MAIQKTNNRGDAFVIIHKRSLSSVRAKPTRFLLRFYECLARVRDRFNSSLERRDRVREQGPHSLPYHRRNPRRRSRESALQSLAGPATPCGPGRELTNLQ